LKDLFVLDWLFSKKLLIFFLKSNFSNYVHRFSMPSSDGKSIGGDNNHFYSINIGPVHLISFSTEFYFYFFKYGLTQLSNQFSWLENDLKVFI